MRLQVVITMYQLKLNSLPASTEKLRDLNEAPPVGPSEDENTGKDTTITMEITVENPGKALPSLAATIITPPPHTPTIPKKDNYYIVISTTPDRDQERSTTAKEKEEVESLKANDPTSLGG
ncbi:hypothetical protein ACJJTC_017969 [Scirpophaga incertulas]